MRIARSFVLVALLAVTYFAYAADDSLALYAAGSLKAALGDVVISYEKIHKNQGGRKIWPQRSVEKGH